MTKKFNALFLAPLEKKKIGYCRAIRMGNFIAVTGTISLDEKGEMAFPGNGHAQTIRCLEIIEKTLEDLGASRKNILRTRMFVTDIKLWSDFGRAHGEFFINNPPATSMLKVKSLMTASALIEIEADAVILD